MTTLKNQKLCMTGLAAILAMTAFASVGGAQAATPMGAAAAMDKAAQIAEARFQSHVRQGYLDIANYAAARTGSTQLADYFRTKAASTENLGLINPENPAYLVTLNGVNIGEARAKLINSLTADQIERNPEIAAAALVNFDCFVREIDRKDETCLQNFAISLASLTQASVTTTMGEPTRPTPTEPPMPRDPEIPDRVVTNPPTPTTPGMPSPPVPPNNPPNHNPDPEEPNPNDPYPGHPHPGHPHPGHPPTYPDGVGDATNGDDHSWQNAEISGHGEGSGGYDNSNRDPGPSTSDQGRATDSKDKGDDKGNNDDNVSRNN